MAQRELQQQEGGRTQAQGARGSPTMDMTFTVTTVPSFRVTMGGAYREKETQSGDNICVPLSTAGPGECAFKLCLIAFKERVFRVRLPADAAAAATVQELTSGRWGIWPSEAKDGSGGMTLACTHRGVHLPPEPLRQLLLDACAPTPPLAPSSTVASALQAHIAGRIVRFAVATTLDAARIALTGRAWADGVQWWMLTPEMEMKAGSTLWTGLPFVLDIDYLFDSAEAAAAAMPLLAAAVRPAPDVARQMVKRMVVQRESGEGAWGKRVEDVLVRVNAAKIQGLPFTTLVWRFDILEGEGQQPMRTLWVSQKAGMGHVHYVDPEGLLALRTRLRGLFPTLAALPDATLMAVLERLVDGYACAVATNFARVRLVPGHPERGDGQPQTEAEWASHRNPIPLPPGTRFDPFAFTSNFSNRGVPEAFLPRLSKAVKEFAALLDAFHRGE